MSSEGRSARIIIVGAGAAGTLAALQLRRRGVLVLDVGHAADAPSLHGNFYDLRRGCGAEATVLFDELIGEGFESLHNVFHPDLSPKLKAPRMRFVTRDADRLAPIATYNFTPAMSFAAGGLANAWGAGLYRFTERDLAGFPIGVGDLDDHYDAMTAKIGISGTADDLSPFFGTARGLHPPVDMDSSGTTLLRRYTRRRLALNRRGLFIGRPRLAVLTREHAGRPPYRYEALEFFQVGDVAVYTPAYTLNELVERQEIDYERGWLVERYAETATGVVITARACDSGVTRTFSCQRLILAAGSLNTARIVLQSNDDHGTRLPLLDNGVSYLPLLDPLRVGAALEPRIYPGAMLNGVYAGDLHPDVIQMTLYGLGGTLRSDYLFEFPLSARGSIVAAKYVTPAMILIQVFHPDRPTPANYLRLAGDGRLELHYASRRDREVERHLLKAFRSMGYLGLTRMCKYLAPGSSFHYAGCLPMTATPRSRYQTDRQGLLAGTHSVYVADAANFCTLASKNHSFTMMANAMRIADGVARTVP
jgi:GMC oxidoreductase